MTNPDLVMLLYSSLFQLSAVVISPCGELVPQYDTFYECIEGVKGGIRRGGGETEK